MRSSFVVGVGAVVVIVALVAFVSLRWDRQPEGADETDQPAGGLVEIPGNGQYFQDVPANNSADEPANSADRPGDSSAEPSSEALPVTGDSPDTAGVTVTLSETGFSPATVTVAAGTTVTFVNNGQAAHWPASDSHPTHQILPGFDAKHGLGTGEAYVYTFTKTGTWPCHDHLMPQHTCTVVVQ